MFNLLVLQNTAFSKNVQTSTLWTRGPLMVLVVCEHEVTYVLFSFRYQDAANRFSRMTSESKDLRSGLLFEQASYCHLASNPPLVRKYAFHIILAGYRYSKAGQKSHAVRAYHQGASIYHGRGWRLAQDHILYSLGHQALLMKDYKGASTLFNELLAGTEPGLTNVLQEMCHLREFFIVHHMREKEETKGSAQAASVTELSIPLFHAQRIVTQLGNEQQPPSHAAATGAVHQLAWQNLERSICERVSGQEILFMARTCQEVFGPNTSNGLSPQLGVGEQVHFSLPVENKFHTRLALKKVQLSWEFKPLNEDGATVAKNSLTLAEGEKYVMANVLNSITLEPHSTSILELSLIPKQAGEVTVTGVDYSVRAQFPTSESTDYW